MKKSETNKKQKQAYVPPKVITLDDQRLAEGAQCVTGGSATNRCVQGTTAATGCEAGGLAGSYCAVGTTPRPGG